MLPCSPYQDPDRVTPKGQWILVRLEPEPESDVIDVVHTKLVADGKTADDEDRILVGRVLKMGPRVKSAIKEGDRLRFSQLRKLTLAPDLVLTTDSALAFVEE